MRYEDGSSGVQHGNVLESVSGRYAGSSRDADSLKVRLETQDIKDKISSYLKGTVITYSLQVDPKTGMQFPVTQEKQIGAKKCNDLGYQDIMSFVESVVNRGTVMGNFKEASDLYGYLTRVRTSFTKHLWVNMVKYGIDVADFNGILTNLFALIEPFMTRTIGDKERETIRETTIQQDRVIHGNSGVNINPLKMFSKSF